MMWRYRGATDFVEGAKFLREETIEIAGFKLDCYVVTVLPKIGGNRSAYTWSVDKQHFHVVRGGQRGVKLRVHNHQAPRAAARRPLQVRTTSGREEERESTLTAPAWSAGSGQKTALPETGQPTGSATRRKDDSWR